MDLMMPSHRISTPNHYLANIRLITTIILSLSVCTLLIAPNLTHAEEEVKDKFRIAIGGYGVPRYDSAVSLTDADLGGGIAINPSETLDLDSEQVVLRLDGHYRFNKKHALTYSWYNISSTGNKIIDEEISWTDPDNNQIVIPIGAKVTSSLDYDIFKLGYLWSFYHSDKVELAAGAGLHLTRVAFDLSADITEPPDSGVKNVSTTVPLPVLSFGVSYFVTPKFHWYIKSEIFAISFDDWKGTYTDGTLGMEYRFWEHVGLGAGLNSNSLRIVQETSDYKFTYDNRISGLLFYVAGYF